MAVKSNRKQLDVHLARRGSILRQKYDHGDKAALNLSLRVAGLPPTPKQDMVIIRDTE